MREAGIAMLIGIMLGILIAVCIIDDMERFTIPGTGKTFVRERPPPHPSRPMKWDSPTFVDDSDYRTPPEREVEDE